MSTATVAVLAVLWWVATHRQWLPPLFLPAPEAVWTAFVDAWHGRIQGGLPLSEHLLWSAARVFGAFLLATAIGVPAGILMGVSRVARGVLDPLLEFYRPLPPLAYLPLVVIWFGIDETAKLVVIFLACFAPIAMAARAGVRAATVEQINAAYSLGGSFAQIVRHVVLPAALPEILTGLRIAIGFGWTTLVAAEMVAATAGLRADGAQRVELPAYRHRRDGDPDHRRDRVVVRSRDAVGRAADRAVEGAGIGCESHRGVTEVDCPAPRTKRAGLRVERSPAPVA